MTYKVSGITRNNSGAVLGSCDVFLFIYNATTHLFTQVGAMTTSNATTGAYSFTGLSDGTGPYCVAFFKSGSPNVFDISDRTLTPVVETVSGDTTTGLVGYWPLDDGSGFTAVDHGPGGHNGTLFGSMFFGAGFAQSAGVNDDVNIPDHADFTFTTAFTAFLWVKAVPTNNGCCFSQYDFGTVNQRSWSMGSSITGAFDKVRAVLRDSGSGGNQKAYVSSITAFESTPAFHSIAMRWNAGVLDIFVDGVKDTAVDKSEADQTLASNSIFNSSAAISIGSLLSDTTPTAPMAVGSQFKKARLYNIAKTDADIAAIHLL